MNHHSLDQTEADDFRWCICSQAGDQQHGDGWREASSRSSVLKSVTSSWFHITAVLLIRPWQVSYPLTSPPTSTLSPLTPDLQHLTPHTWTTPSAHPLRTLTPDCPSSRGHLWKTLTKKNYSSWVVMKVWAQLHPNRRNTIHPPSLRPENFYFSKYKDIPLSQLPGCVGGALWVVQNEWGPMELQP